MTILFVLSNVIDSVPFRLEQPEYFVPVCKQIRKYLTFHLGSNFNLFRIIPAISANFSRNANFNQYKILTEKKKKIIKNSYLLLLGFVLFFLFFFLISVSSSSSSFFLSSSSFFLSSSSSSSSSSFGFGLLPNYLFFFICVSLAVLHLCLDFRAFRL